MTSYLVNLNLLWQSNSYMFSILISLYFWSYFVQPVDRCYPSHGPHTTDRDGWPTPQRLLGSLRSLLRSRTRLYKLYYYVNTHIFAFKETIISRNNIWKVLRLWRQTKLGSPNYWLFISFYICIVLPSLQNTLIINFLAKYI